MYLSKEVNNTILTQPGNTTIPVKNNSAGQTVDTNAQKDMPPIDMAYLRQFSGGDVEFEKDIIGSSINEIEEKMALLTAALQKQNMVSVGDIAHSLKSLCSIIGATKQFEWYKAVETFCTHISTAETEDICKKAEAFWPSVKTYLQQYMQQGNE